MTDPVDIVMAGYRDPAEPRPLSALSALSAPPAEPRLELDSPAFLGLAGDVVRAIEPNTEADPAGLLLNVLAGFGAMVGGMAEARVGFTHHPPALFVALVGRSSRSRKDTATAEVQGVMSAVEEGWHDRHGLSGFASGEAFIEQAASQQGESIFMTESELSRLFANASREGSTVSSVMRAAWGFQRMQHRLRGKAYAAPPAPVTLMAHITADELRDPRGGLRPVEALNGFGNRILWVFVDRRRRLPSPKPVPARVLAPLIGRLRETLEAARGAGFVERTPEAEELWDELYAVMDSDDGWGVVDSLTARAEAQVLRLSLIFALLDGSRAIDRPHLEAAWEVWRYCRWSAQHIWIGAGTGDPDVDRIAAVLADGVELTGRELDQMFRGHRSTRELREKAVRFGIAAVLERESGGRPSKVLVARSAVAGDKADKADKAQWWRGAAGEEG